MYTYVAALLLCTAASLFAIELRRDPVGSFGAANSCSPDALRGEVFDLPSETYNLPNFEKLKPVGLVCASTLNIPTRAFLAGIPGVTTRIEWFAIDYQGDFWIETPGAYMFTLASDDGSKLYIDGKSIIDNDGHHATIELGGRAKLEAGKHHMRVSYFQGPREYVALVLKIAPPHGIFEIFDMRAYRPRARSAALIVEDESRPILRRSVLAHDPLAGKAYEVAALGALQAQPRAHDFDLYAKAFRFRTAEDVGTTQYALAFEIPGAGLTATSVDDRRSRLHVVLVALVKDAAGKVVQKISEDFPVELSRERLAGLKNSSFRLTRSMSLSDGGNYTIDVAAIDRESNRASTVSLQVEGTRSSAVGLSDLVLVRRVETATGSPDASDPLEFQGRRVVPEMAPAVPGSAEPSVYFAIYPNPKNSAKPAIIIELALDGRVLGRQTSALPEPDATGAIPLTIAAPAKPGRNRLKIIIQQGSESAERVLEYLISAK